MAIEKEFEELADCREQTEEIPFKLKQAKKNMAKRLRKRMVELGLSKNAMDLTMFNEFQIKDMI